MDRRKLWYRWLARFRIVSVAAAVSVLPGCGSSTTPTPIPTPAPTPPPPIVETIVSSGSGTVPNRVLAFIPFTTSAAGRIDVTVDWTFATNDVHVYLVRGDCTFEQFVARQCTIVTFSESTIAKPERLTAPGSSAGNYLLLIGNAGPADESVAFQVVLTTGGATSALSPSAVLSGRGQEYWGSIDLNRKAP